MPQIVKFKTSAAVICSVTARWRNTSPDSSGSGLNSLIVSSEKASLILMRHGGRFPMQRCISLGSRTAADEDTMEEIWPVEFCFMRQREIFLGDRGGVRAEMWSGKTRAAGWQIGEDGHCGSENETPNLLWSFPWAPRWRSVQGRGGKIGKGRQDCVTLTHAHDGCSIVLWGPSLTKRIPGRCEANGFSLEYSWMVLVWQWEDELRQRF